MKDDLPKLIVEKCFEKYRRLSKKGKPKKGQRQRGSERKVRTQALVTRREIILSQIASSPLLLKLS